MELGKDGRERKLCNFARGQDAQCPALVAVETAERLLHVASSFLYCARMRHHELPRFGQGQAARASPQ